MSAEAARPGWQIRILFDAECPLCAREGRLLKRLDGGTYSQTSASGTPSYGMQGSSIMAGSVEMSNTDIAEEFSKMIVTQQAYSANTRVITTAQQMLQDVINVIR